MKESIQFRISANLNRVRCAGVVFSTVEKRRQINVCGKLQPSACIFKLPVAALDLFLNGNSDSATPSVILKMV